VIRARQIATGIPYPPRSCTVTDVMCPPPGRRRMLSQLPAGNVSPSSEPVPSPSEALGDCGH
jgi:hypothetical protein